MSKIIIVVVLVVMVAGVFRVLAEEQLADHSTVGFQEIGAALDEQPSPSPLTRFERSLLGWGELQNAATVDAMTPSPLTRFERSLLAWEQARVEAAAPSPLTRFEQSLLRWAQLQSEKQILS